MNLIHRVAATDKCNNTVECEKYSQKTTSKLVSHGKKKNKTAKSMSNNKLKTNTNSPHRASATDNCKNTVECEKVSQKTISKLVLRNKKINKTEKHMSNNRSKTNKNSPHGASETDKCNNNVECEKDSQKIISKLILLSKKKNKTVKHMSNNRSKTKHNSSHNAFANDKCNNTADYINYSQKCHNLSKYIDSNDTRMDINMNNIEESSMNKSTILEQVFKTKSRKVSILNSTDLTQNPSTNTKSVVYNSSSNPIGNMNFATGIHYEMLRIIIYKNYYFYNRNCLCKLAKIFTEKHLLLNLPESWHPNAVQLVKSLLEDLFKLLKHFKFKKVVFTACLSVLYRRINFSYKSEEMYRYFIVFIDVIKMCTMRIDEHLWKSLIPNDWNKIFINGCLIIDYILYGNLTNSMYLYVDWDAMPDVKVLYNTYLNELQSQNLLNSTSTELEQLEIYISVNDWFSDSPILTDDCESSDDISFFTNTSKMKVVTAPLGDELDSVDVQSKRPDIIKNSSISGFSCMNTFTIMQNNDKENKKRKHSISQTNVDEQVVKKIPSHYTIHQLHAQSMCLQTPKFPRSNNQFKQRSDDHTLFNEEVQSEPISLHTNIEDLSKLQNIQDYEPQRVQYGFTQNIQVNLLYQIHIFKFIKLIFNPNF